MKNENKNDEVFFSYFWVRNFVFNYKSMSFKKCFLLFLENR